MSDTDIVMDTQADYTLFTNSKEKSAVDFIIAKLSKFGMASISSESVANTVVQQIDANKFLIERRSNGIFIIYDKELKEDYDIITKSKDTASRILRLIPGNINFFLDDCGDAYAKIPFKNHSEYWALKSSEFRKNAILWCMNLQDAPTRDKIGNIVSLAEGLALKDPKQFTLRNRIMRQGEQELDVDLVTKDWKYVVINKEGWTKKPLDSPMFKRFSHMKEMLVESGTKNDYDNWLKLSRIPSSNAVLISGYIGASFVADNPTPILQIIGAEGTGKTSTCIQISSLCDPSSTTALNLANDKDLVEERLSQRHSIVFDNVKHISSDISDLICSAVTGFARERRRLYTDSEMGISKIMSNIILNGILEVSKQPDLRDRFLTFEQENFAQGETRLEEALLKSRLEELSPKVRGYVFDCLSRAIILLPEVRKELQVLPRLSGFCVWGEATTRAMGYPKLAFYQAYMTKINEQAIETLAEHPLASYILQFLEESKTGYVECTGKDLHGNIKRLLEQDGTDSRDKTLHFPNSPNGFTQLLKRFKVSLQRAGWEWERAKVGGVRGYVFRRRTGLDTNLSINLSKPDDDEKQGKLTGLDRILDNLRQCVGEASENRNIDTTNFIPKNDENLSKPVNIDDKIQDRLENKPVQTCPNLLKTVQPHASEISTSSEVPLGEVSSCPPSPSTPPESHSGAPGGHRASPLYSNLKGKSAYTVIYEIVKFSQGMVIPAPQGEYFANSFPWHTAQEYQSSFDALRIQGDIYYTGRGWKANPREDMND